MKSRKGQATRISLLVLHQFGHVAMLVLLLALVLFALFGFRLSRGPIEIPHLASWFATHFTGEGVDVRVARAELAWAGYAQGGEVPFVLKLGGIEVQTQSGAALADVPDSVLSLPVVDLFGGRKAITLTGAGATFPYSDVPVSWYAQFWPGAGFTLLHSDVHVQVGAGAIGQGRNAVALNHASFTLSVLHDGSVQVMDGQAQLARHGHSAPNLTFSSLGRYDHNWQGTLTVGVDEVQAQDLASVWPPDLLPTTRSWITTHITSGRAHDAIFTFGLAAQGDLSRLRINHLQGQFAVDDMSLIWLTGAPPLEHLNGTFAMQDLNTGLITATSGDVQGIRLKSGSLKITGLAGSTQTGALEMNLAGPVQTVLQVLTAPPLDLLGHVLDDVKKATGTAQATLKAEIPFKKDLKENEISLKVAAELSNLRVPTPITGVFFTNGRMSLQSDGHRLSATATADLAGSPVSMTLEQDLSSPSGYGQFTMSGEAGATLWQMLGRLTPYVTIKGTAPFHFMVRGAANGPEQIDLSADLGPSGLAVPALGWAKPVGSPGGLSAKFTLQGQQLVAVQHVTIQAPGLLIQGQEAGNVFTLQQAQVGRNQMSGTLVRPRGPGEPWVLQGRGAVLDIRLQTLSAGLHQTHRTREQGSQKLAWRADLTFDKVYTVAPPAPPLLAVRLTASGNAGKLTSANFSAQGVKAVVTPRANDQRSLTMQADDAGAVLAALGVYGGISGGVLDLKAVFGDSAAQGTLWLKGARLVHAPGFIKVLQAATLYGVAEALSGPGLLLDHTTIPFTLEGERLTVNGADSYSEALGFTASGTVNIAAGTCNLDTTIIPAYALNSFLGRLPLIGHLFTAENGGGLFAMRAHVQGKLDDPEVSVNPLSVFTPGFLRGIFGLGRPEPQHPKQ